MISLVITIIVTIILVWIVVTGGYTYLNQANEFKRTALSKTISAAAFSRQQDLSGGTTNAFYDGYIFDISPETTYRDETIPNKYVYINYLPSGDEDLDLIPDCLQHEGALWYLVDAESATNLGTDGAEELLTRNIAYTDAFDKEELVRLVLTDYATGEGYFVTMPAEIAISSINQSIGFCPNSPDGRHRFTIATCTEDSKCVYNCGATGTPALGHNFSVPTCTAPEICSRCGTEGEPALGHQWVTNSQVNNDVIKNMFLERETILIQDDSIESNSETRAWVADAVKHWHECLRCGQKDEEELHIKGYIEPDDTTHQEQCSKCGWKSGRVKHNFGPPVSISAHSHTRECLSCHYVATHLEIIPSGNSSDNAWFPDHDAVHYRICPEDDCNSLLVSFISSNKNVVFKEEHYDNNHDFKCDICGRGLDNIPPVDFGIEEEGTYAKVKSTTTSSITLEAYTIDKELGLDYYQFGIYNEETGMIEWRNDKVRTNTVANYTFTGLKPNSTYVFYVRAFDTSGNSNSPYRVEGTTRGFPDFNGLENWPTTDYVGPGTIVKVKEIITDLPNIKLLYAQNDVWHSTTYSQGTPLDDINSISITLNKEFEKLEFRFVDDAENKSDIYTFTTTKVDATPPVVSVEGNGSESAMRHSATVVIEDVRSGIEQNTEVHYAWTTTKTTPTTYETIHTENLETASKVTFDVLTPAEVEGEFYLWIGRGIVDAVGNATTTDTWSPMTFIVDDMPATLSEITMLNLNPAVTGERLFVKTDGTVTITFKASKELFANPVVRVNGQNVDTISHSGLNYTCKIQITDEFREGTLQLEIGQVMSANGKLSSAVYTNSDIYNNQGPVFYDKTNPLIEYVPKT